MKRDEILKLLAAHREGLAAFGVKSLAVFGSVARDEARPGSDVDILVEFAVPVGLFEFVRLKRHLEDLLGQPVDLVTPDALGKVLREHVLSQAVYAS